MNAPIVVIGAGGHAKVIVGLLKALGEVVEACVDDDDKKHGSNVLGVPIVGPDRVVAGADRRGLIAIGRNEVRKRVANDLKFAWATVVHPRAFVDPSVILGEGTVVFAGAVVQPDCRIGAHVIINTSASVDHDARIGDYVHLAPGVHLAGDVRVDEGAFLGTGVAVIPQRTVGAWSTIGAGAAVVRDIPSDVTALGVPARIKS